MQSRKLFLQIFLLLFLYGRKTYFCEEAKRKVDYSFESIRIDWEYLLRKVSREKIPSIDKFLCDPNWVTANDVLSFVERHVTLTKKDHNSCIYRKPNS